LKSLTNLHNNRQHIPNITPNIPSTYEHTQSFQHLPTFKID
jgi:hypothetical protein